MRTKTHNKTAAPFPAVKLATGCKKRGNPMRRLFKEQIFND
jgi:hypothetical protein